MEAHLSPELTTRLADLYARMEAAYDETARKIGLTCEGCPDNCCDSYFLHHTYVEWAYLWQGLERLPKDKRNEVINRARIGVNSTLMALAAGEVPATLCPLNEEGRCILYNHRLMICRLHGVPARLTFPDGKAKDFPGCFRCQELSASLPDVPRMERSGLLNELAQLEKAFIEEQRGKLVRVKKTIAQMIAEGPPELLTL